VRDLGVGGFGRVIEVELPYKAWDNLPWSSSRPKRFAMKIQPKHRSQQTAATEALALQRVRHPFIVKLKLAFATQKFFVLLLELCHTDLNRILCETKVNGQCLGLPPDRAARYLGQVLLALAHLHEVECIVYRDVKPENILISELDEAKLADFGLAEEADADTNRRKTGTMGFFAPELAEATVRQLSIQSETAQLRSAFTLDTYSFGVTLQLTLLGENAGQIRDVRRKGLVMLPSFDRSDRDNIELLGHLRDVNLICQDAYALLVDHLLVISPLHRACLSDSHVQNHMFFLRALGCENLKDHLLSSRQPGTDSPSSPRSFRNRTRSWSGVSLNSLNREADLEAHKVPLLAEQPP
jgi:serine/threonine protein kinase